MLVADLLPMCTIENCPKRGKHRHLLPHQPELLESNAKYIYCQGGYGSTKTLTATIKAFLTLANVPGGRWFIGRRTLPKLHDSTQRIFMEVLERSGLEGCKFQENRDGWSHHITFPNGSEVFFRPTSDLGRFLGPEYSGFLIDEAQEEPEETFKDLMGRLRLPHLSKYLCGMLLSNPPARNSWLFKQFGDKPGPFEKSIEVNGKLIKTRFHFLKWSTRLNSHVADQYIADLITTYGEDEALRIIDGEYGFTSKGQPVYRPPFSQFTHVGEPKYNPSLSLIRSWDFGSRHPAVTWHQVWYCKHAVLHWYILRELTECYEIETPELYKAVAAAQKVYFPNHASALTLDCGDRAGTNKSDRGAGPIMVLQQPPYNLRFRYKWCDILPGVDFIKDLLRKPTCKCGEPIVQVHRDCIAVIGGFAGGYHFPQHRPETGPKEKPYKDGYYDDPMDSVRYAAENYVRMASQNRDFLGEILHENVASAGRFNRNAWEWLKA